MPRRGAAQGLFAQPGEKEQIEFGYCFDVSSLRVSFLSSATVKGELDQKNSETGIAQSMEILIICRFRIELSSLFTYISTSSNSYYCHSLRATRQIS